MPKKSLCEKKSWHYHARRLYGESERIQRRSHKYLKKLKNLDQLLSKQIKGGRHRQLALDVVASLQKFNFMPLLIEESKKDETGLTYLTINALINSKNRQHIAELYGIRLKNNNMNMASKVVLIDTLGRLKEPVHKDLVKSWLEKGPYELKSAALNYLRRTKMLFVVGDFREMLKVALKQEPYQIRLQAIHNFSGQDLDFSLCIEDENAEVVSACKYRQQHLEVKW